MAQAFEVKQEDRTYRFFFAEPAFDAFASLSALGRALYPALQRHSFRLPDIQLEAAEGNLGQMNLRCLSAHASVRFYLDRIEIWAEDWSSRRELAGDVIDSLRSHLQSLDFASFEVIARWHGLLSDIPAAEFVARFTVAAPNGLGPQRGAGLVFYYGADSGRLSSSLTLDLSNLVSEGLFVQGSTILDAGTMDPRKLIAFSEDQWSTIFSQLGLEPIR